MTDVRGSSRVYIDSTIFIDAFEGEALHASALQSLFLALRDRPLFAATSELTLAELFGKVSPKGWVWQKRFYLDLIVFSKIFNIRSVTRSILIDTGDLRRAAASRGRNPRLPDAIHAVTALDAGCQYLFTRDKRFFVTAPLELLESDGTGLTTLQQALDA